VAISQRPGPLTRGVTGARIALSRPLLSLVIAAGLWGGAVSGTKFALRGFDPMVLLCAELVAATVTLWGALLVSGCRRPASWRVPILLGLLEPALAYLGDTVGLSHTNAVDGSIISGLESGLVVVLAVLLLGEAITGAAVVAVALGLGGLVITAGGGDGGSAFGDLCVTAGVLSASLYSIAAKRFDDGADPLALTTWQFSSATVIALSVAAVRWSLSGTAPQLSAAPRYWVAACAVGAVGLACSFLLYNRVLARADAGWTAIVLNLIPVFGMLSAIALLGEELSGRAGAGALLVGASVIYFTMSDRRGSDGTVDAPASITPPHKCQQGLTGLGGCGCVVGGAGGFSFGDELGEDLPQPSSGGPTSQTAVVLEGLVGGRDRELLVKDASAGQAERFAQLGLGPGRAEHAGAGADHGDGLVGQRGGGRRGT
jgi:O-acetylserine/cysteine efflux transporter